MSSLKAALKAAKAALDHDDFVEAEKQARLVTDEDAENYFGWVFLGRSLEKQSRFDEAVESYVAATKIKNRDELAWKGLCGVYEAQGSRGIAGHTSAALKLSQVYQEQQDLEKCQSTVDHLVLLAKEHGSRTQYTEALQVYLPSSPVYDFLEGRIQHPAMTFIRLAEITETDEKERIHREIGQRRTRLGAKLSQVQLDVKREVFKDSKLEHIYQQVIDWTASDDERREYEERLLQHAYDHMMVLLSDDKVVKRKQVQSLAHGMVIIKHPYKLAWNIELEWSDVEDIASIDRNVLLEYIIFFPRAGLSKVLQGYLGQKFEPPAANNTAEEERKSQPEPLGPEEDLVLIDNGITESQESGFAHRLVAEYYLMKQEYQSCVDVSRRAQRIFKAEKERCGLRFENSIDAVLLSLATSLVYYQAPKNHPEAKTIFNDLLKQKPTLTSALLGIGLIHEEQEDFERASDFLERALSRDPDNIRIASEAAWCSALNHRLKAGCNALLDCLSKLESDKHSPRDLNALVSYRVGKSLWDLHPKASSRKDRQGPYAYFIASIRANASYAPAYTSLGVYYLEYAKDKKRARQCFQKAFELSATETTAAEELARKFAKDGEWDIVEAVAERVIDSGAVKPQPGSKRKAISWPFAALGIVQMHKQDFPSAVQSYQSALRVRSEDYHSWVGLGESYLSSGRYNAASKTLEHARSMPSDKGHGADMWFADYMYSNVQRELGQYNVAIEGYRQILQARAGDFGVTIALLQTLVEHAVDANSKGFFYDAIESAREAVMLASSSSEYCGHVANYWKAVGDACMLFVSNPVSLPQVPFPELNHILQKSHEADRQHWRELVDLDEVDAADDSSMPDSTNTYNVLQRCLTLALCAQKMAVLAAAQDFHAKAVAWYNLGWTEYHVSQLLEGNEERPVLHTSFSACATAAVKCFKRAIELEAGNADFWNALGVVTTSLSPKIAQHAFVRSLHLNERSARSWTNLGTLYLTLEDYELAHEAFSRAQSTDPDYVNAWVGEGLVALGLGDQNEAYSHFGHAFEIADSSEVIAKKQFLAIVFGSILQKNTRRAVELLMAPIFASQQLQSQIINPIPVRQLLALLLERAGDYDTAIYHLSALSEQIEAQYEESESAKALGQFVRIKADLARVQLAVHNDESALDNATTALDLSEEADDQALNPKVRAKTRLSAHLIAGLVHYFQNSMDDSVSHFRAALEESNSDPDIVCLLAQVLWAQGGKKERSVAKDRLVDISEKHVSHVDARTTLAAIAVADADKETFADVASDLSALRTRDDVSIPQKARIDELLILAADILGSNKDSLSETQRTIMIDPSQMMGWSKLVDLRGDSSSAKMKLQTAMEDQSVEDVAWALADVRTAPEAQRSAMLCPWKMDGWDLLKSAMTMER